MFMLEFVFNNFILPHWLCYTVSNWTSRYKLRLLNIVYTNTNFNDITVWIYKLMQHDFNIGHQYGKIGMAVMFLRFLRLYKLFLMAANSFLTNPSPLKRCGNI